MENLGLIKDGKLTKEGKEMIIARIRNILAQGGENSPFPCKSGKNIKPVPPDQSLPEDIEDEAKYPEFHNIIMKQYESVLLSLNQQGNFSLPPPFMDPVALAKFLSPPPGQEKPEPTPEDDINNSPDTIKRAIEADKPGNSGVLLNQFPAGEPNQGIIFSPELIAKVIASGPLAPMTLAALLEINPFDLIAKLALPPTSPEAIIKPPLPKFDLPIPPVLSDPYLLLNANISLPVPALGFSIPYPDKIEFDSWQLKLPKFFVQLLTNIISDPPSLLKLISPNPEPCFIIDAAEEIGLFGTPEAGASVRSAVQKDLMTITGQATAVNVVAQTIGDGGINGATGYVGDKLFLLPPSIREIRSEAVKIDESKSSGAVYITAVGDEEGGEDGGLFSGPEFSGLAAGPMVNWHGKLRAQPPAFRRGIRAISAKFDWHPNWLNAIMGIETGSKTAYNPLTMHGGALYTKGAKPAALGLIQFTMLKADGSYDDAKLAKLSKMSQMQQLMEVYTFYKNKHKGITSLGGLRVRNGGIPPEGFAIGSKNYEGNKALDTSKPKDGITPAEVAASTEAENKAQRNAHGEVND